MGYDERDIKREELIEAIRKSLKELVDFMLLNGDETIRKKYNYKQLFQDGTVIDLGIKQFINKKE